MLLRVRVSMSSLNGGTNWPIFMALGLKFMLLGIMPASSTFP